MSDKRHSVKQHGSVEKDPRTGRLRIAAATVPGGGATVQHYDREGKVRIAAATLSSGNTTVQHHDSKGKVVWVKTSE
jgi:O-glycosyl hydrolase